MSTIKEIATKYIGFKEIPPNQGFEDAKFHKDMIGVGFYRGAPWCGFFCSLVWKEAKVSAPLIKRVSPSSYLSYKNAFKGRYLIQTPVIGSVAVFWKYKNAKYQGNGHLAIVSDVTTTTYNTIDGNSNFFGSLDVRDGGQVATRNRSLNDREFSKSNGLRLMGFIYPY